MEKRENPKTGQKEARKRPEEARKRPEEARKRPGRGEKRPGRGQKRPEEARKRKRPESRTYSKKGTKRPGIQKLAKNCSKRNVL